MKLKYSLPILSLLVLYVAWPANPASSEPICDLETLYQHNNDDYFLGQLPKTADVRWSDMTNQHDMGMAWISEDGVVHIRI